MSRIIPSAVLLVCSLASCKSAAPARPTTADEARLFAGCARAPQSDGAMFTCRRDGMSVVVLVNRSDIREAQMVADLAASYDGTPGEAGRGIGPHPHFRAPPRGREPATLTTFHTSPSTGTQRVHAISFDHASEAWAVELVAHVAWWGVPQGPHAAP